MGGSLRRCKDPDTFHLSFVILSFLTRFLFDICDLRFAICYLLFGFHTVLLSNVRLEPMIGYQIGLISITRDSSSRSQSITNNTLK